MQAPETRYARSGDLSIAYAVAGKGPLDIFLCSNWTSHVEAMWEWPPAARLIHRLATLGRVIVFDMPGSGLSDPVSLVELPTIEQWTDHVGAVLDAAGSERAVLFGSDAGACLALPFAATHPDRVSALILFGAYARFHRAPDYPHGYPEERREEGLAWWLDRWGTGRQLELTAPELADDPFEVEPMARIERFATSPGVARVFFRMIGDLDVRDVLPAVHVPTLVLHRSGDRWIRPEHGRYLAERIQGARHVELDGDSHYAFHGNVDELVREIRGFLDGLPERTPATRMLATILITDIVESTRAASELGDERWEALRQRHDSSIRDALSRFRGREVAGTGDGFIAVFDGAARAVRCALAIRDALRPLGLEVRAGIHSGEIESGSDGIEGIAVNIASRVVALAAPGEVLASQTVKDLTVGSRLEFESRETHTLKGVPGVWSMYAALG
jgi:class 3 adenylate cyclase